MNTVPDTLPETALTPSRYRLSFARVLHGEWIKLASLRSTWWSIGIVAALSIGLSLLIAASIASSMSGVDAQGVATFSSVMAVLAPMQFTILLAGSIGAIAVTGEYSTGMIRSTLTAEPRRGAVIASKALVVAVLLFAASLAIFAVAALATAPILGDAGIAIPWDDPARSWAPIVYGALSMACFALIGLSSGFVVRNGPGAIALAVGILFVLPILPSMFAYGDDWQWVHDIAQFLPMNAAQSLVSPGTDFGLPDAPAIAALLAWVATGLAGSWAVLRSRDA